MVTPSPEEVTRLLLDWSNGDQAAIDKLMPLVYGELHRLARHYMRRERPDHTLQTSALINEAYLRLVDQSVSWQNRAHFFGICARLMRQILMEYARSRNLAKRGGNQQKVSLDEVLVFSEERAAELVAIDDALKKLAAIDERKSTIVELKFFGGLSIDEMAEVLGISTPTVEREWRSAKTWLYRVITEEKPDKD